MLLTWLPYTFFHHILLKSFLNHHQIHFFHTAKCLVPKHSLNIEWTNLQNQSADSTCQLLPLSDNTVLRHQADRELDRKQVLSKHLLSFIHIVLELERILEMDDSPPGDTFSSMLTCFLHLLKRMDYQLSI